MTNAPPPLSTASRPLRSFLRARGLTFDWVATVTERSVRTCQKWEIDRPVPADAARALAKASQGELSLSALRPDIWGDSVTDVAEAA